MSDERYLAQISALIDGELEPDRVLDTLDYLVSTPAARRFYRQARAVDGLFQGAGRKPVSEPSSRELWQRISDDVRRPETTDQPTPNRSTTEESVATPFTGAARSPGVRIWLAAAAVLLLAAVGLFSLRIGQARPEIARSETIEQLSDVTVGGASGEMTDTRFLALATELLEADRRYRREMLALMTAVEEAPLAESTTQETLYDEGPVADESEPSESDPFRFRPRIERW